MYGELEYKRFQRQLDKMRYICPLGLLGLQGKKDNHRKMEKSKCLVNGYLLDHAETMSDRKFLVSKACQGASTTPSPDSV